MALSSGDDKRMQSIDTIETYAYGRYVYAYRKDQVSEKEEIRCNNIGKRDKKWLPLMMFTKKNIKENNPNWPQIPHHPYRILIIGDSGSGK